MADKNDKNEEDWICRTCRKKIKLEVIKCIPCAKIFHPGCVQMHKVYNRNKEITCTGDREAIKRTKESNSMIENEDHDKKE